MTKIIDGSNISEFIDSFEKRLLEGRVTAVKRKPTLSLDQKLGKLLVDARNIYRGHEDELYAAEAINQMQEAVGFIEDALKMVVERPDDECDDVTRHEEFEGRKDRFV